MGFLETYKPRYSCSFQAEKIKIHSTGNFFSFNLIGYFPRMSRFSVSVNAVELCQPFQQSCMAF